MPLVFNFSLSFFSQTGFCHTAAELSDTSPPGLELQGSEWTERTVSCKHFIFFHQVTHILSDFLAHDALAMCFRSELGALRIRARNSFATASDTQASSHSLPQGSKTFTASCSSGQVGTRIAGEGSRFTTNAFHMVLLPSHLRLACKPYPCQTHGEACGQQQASTACCSRPVPPAAADRVRPTFTPYFGSPCA